MLKSRLDVINKKVKKSRVAIIVRFSHVNVKHNPFKISKNKDFEEYCSDVFDESRLKQRFYFFEKYCLPSFDAQEDRDFCLILKCSTLLPDIWKERLIGIAETRDYIYLNFLSPSENPWWGDVNALNNVFSEEKGPVITCRVDDDDAVAKNYIKEVKSYLHEKFKGFALSFGSGYYVYERAIRKNSYELEYKMPHLRYVNIACGIAYVGGRYMLKKNVNSFNVNHVFIDKKVPTIVDSRKPMFMVSAHDAQDTNRKSKKEFDMADWIPANKIPSEIKDFFPGIIF